MAEPACAVGVATPSRTATGTRRVVRMTTVESRVDHDGQGRGRTTGPRFEQRTADGEQAEHRGQRVARQAEDEPVRRAREERRAAGPHRDRRHEELRTEVARGGPDAINVRMSGAARRHDEIDRIRADRGAGRFGVVAHPVDRGDLGPQLVEDRRQRDPEAVAHPARRRDAGLDDFVAREHEGDAGTTPDREPVGARRRREGHARRGQQHAGVEHGLAGGCLGAGRFGYGDGRRHPADPSRRRARAGPRRPGPPPHGGRRRQTTARAPR